MGNAFIMYNASKSLKTVLQTINRVSKARNLISYNLLQKLDEELLAYRRAMELLLESNQMTAFFEVMQEEVKIRMLRAGLPTEGKCINCYQGTIL